MMPKIEMRGRYKRFERKKSLLKVALQIPVYFEEEYVPCYE